MSLESSSVFGVDNSLFKELGEKEKLLPLSIEQLSIYKASNDLIVHRLQRPPSLWQISASLKNSVVYVQNLINNYS